MTPISMTVVTVNGTTTVPLTRDANGWVADHDGQRFLIKTVKEAAAVTPAKARFA